MLKVCTTDKQEKLAQKHLLKRLYYDYDPKHHDAFVLMYNKDCENRRLREYMENREIIKPSVRRYKKKPVVVFAIRWTGNNLKDVIAFTGLHESAKKWTWEEYEEVVRKEGLKIFTLEGPLMASIGDMIVRGIAGEFYPCKPDIFKNTYEEIDDDLATILD